MGKWGITMLVSWKRSLQLAYYNHYLITKVNKEKYVNWLIVELGLDNVTEENINKELDHILIGFNRLFKYKSITQASLGYFRMLDIVKSGDLYYPRIYVLLPMIKSYFQGRYYIKHDNWVSLWSKALNRENNLFVKMKVVSSKNVDQDHGIVLKMEQGLSILHDVDNTKIPINFNPQLQSRRLIGYSKLLKDVMDQIESDQTFDLDMDQFDVKDSIANCAFENMLEWHPGFRFKENNPFFNLK
ncbi:protein rep [Paenibacillus pseudetheri]|nr:protein rep [Paenibacillus pseudetheri]